MDLKADILFKDVVADTDPEEVERQLRCCANEWFYPEITKIMPEVHVSIAPPPEAPPQFEPSSEPLPGMPVSPLVESPARFVIPDGPRTPSMKHLVARLLHGDHLPQPKSEKPALDSQSRPIYVVSDLHLGDSGPRDNFAHMSDGNRMSEFWSFLDFVEGQNGRLIIAGDLFELWQSNVSRVLTLRIRLLDRLAKMGTIYILGNHDADLRFFCEDCWLKHPFFRTMRTQYTERIGDKSFHFIHGHEVDYYCAGDNPGLGRITAIYSGLREDRNGSPLLNKYKTIEARSNGRFERFSNFIRWCCGKPSRTRLMNEGLRGYIREFGVANGGKYDVLISGHTHVAGQMWSKRKGSLPVYNAGTWAEGTCSFVAISPGGGVRIFDWIDNQLESNWTRIKV